MHLSQLQKYILMQCLNQPSEHLDRAGLVKFYKNKNIPKAESRVKIITKSIENLIDKEFLVGRGVRTSHKWFIKEISLTKKGIKQTKRLIGEQLRLPFKNK